MGTSEQGSETCSVNGLDNTINQYIDSNELLQREKRHLNRFAEWCFEDGHPERPPSIITLITVLRLLEEQIAIRIDTRYRYWYLVIGQKRQRPVIHDPISDENVEIENNPIDIETRIKTSRVTVCKPDSRPFARKQHESITLLNQGGAKMIIPGQHSTPVRLHMDVPESAIIGDLPSTEDPGGVTTFTPLRTITLPVAMTIPEISEWADSNLSM